jgi:hypothetical protein
MVWALVFVEDGFGPVGPELDSLCHGTIVQGDGEYVNSSRRIPDTAGSVFKPLTGTNTQVPVHVPSVNCRFGAFCGLQASKFTT